MSVVPFQETSWLRVAALSVLSSQNQNIANGASAQLQQTKDATQKRATEINTAGIENPPLTADDLDETNTRLFVKSLSPELHDYAFLYRMFRAFGKIRMLALNTKRHNALVEYETKAAALAAKRDCKCISALSGRTYSIKMFWGKHIHREPPVKHAPPTFDQQVELVRQVDTQQMTRNARSSVPHTWLAQMLGLFTNSEPVPAEESSSFPPGLTPKPDSIEQWFSYCDVNNDTCGKYPLKSSNEWFTGEKRISKPATSARTQSLSASVSPSTSSDLAYLGMSATLPFSKWPSWDLLLDMPSPSNSTSSLPDFSSSFCSSFSSLAGSEAAFDEVSSISSWSSASPSFQLPDEPHVSPGKAEVDSFDF